MTGCKKVMPVTGIPAKTSELRLISRIMRKMSPREFEEGGTLAKELTYEFGILVAREERDDDDLIIWL